MSSDEPEIIVPARIAQWKRNHYLASLTDQVTTYYVQASGNGSITVSNGSDIVTVPASLVPWFVRTCNLAGSWISDQ